MNPTYEEIEAKIALLEVQLKLSEAAERAWESSMMRACGEDGPKSVADKFSELKAKCAALAAENAALKISILNTQGAIELACAAVNDDRRGDVFRDILNAIYVKTASETPATDAFLAEVRAQGVKSLSNAVQSVISERQRQQSVEGWTPEHDDEHTEGEMAEAAACYAMFANNQGFSVPGLWPWAREWWKQSGQRRDLVKAGALILAEIERIDRQEAAQ